ncbi:hypothetical protein [Aquibacillus sediminis]|uniref:hypothetical protein n=1 Tax=Aquibacillus sediminis TaxID=2574734 RepID=UPI001108AE1D|nr:hypothetical protein [Aquibacillus sediminis]
MISFDRVVMDGISDMVFIVRVEGESFYYEFLNRAAMEQTGMTNSAIGKEIRKVNRSKLTEDLYHQYVKAVTSRQRTSIPIYHDLTNQSIQKRS